MQLIVRLTALLVLAGLALAHPARYAVILEDAPVAERLADRGDASAPGRDYRRLVAQKQATLRAELSRRRVQVTGSASTLINALFVSADPSRRAELAALPGVKGVVRVRYYRHSLNRATELLNAPAAWSAVGGPQNGGAGVKIAILDTGIDQTHPAFQDPSLAMPAGYPLCSPGDCDFTSAKVIVARSYVRQLAAGSDPNNPAADSRPDDYTPRDRDGHGTSVASCAAASGAGGTVPIRGMAPKAYLGNYKIYGSPQVNDFTSDDVIIQALEDAIADGMDIISFSSGGSPFTGPLDTGAVCGNPDGVPCDLSAYAFEQAARQGVIIVAAAGNEGDYAYNVPAFGSISSPASAPSVIAAGATTNSHSFIETLSAAGQNAPSNLLNVSVQTGDANILTGAITGTLIDVTTLGDDGLGCSGFPTFSLNNTIALIKRGTCTFATKMQNAVNAGAIGVVFYQQDPSVTGNFSGLSSFSTPAVLIANSDGLAMKDWAAKGGGVIIDPAGAVSDSGGANLLTSFSSVGPAIGTTAIKPDIVATGDSIYMAAERVDPLGELYSSTGYAAASGTSFATPLTSGAAALVKQRHPGYNSAQVKSALVNTAAPSVTSDDSGNSTGVVSVGGGLVDAAAAASQTVTSSPASLGFGGITASSLPAAQTLTLANAGNTTVNLTLSVNPANPAAASLALDKQAVSIPAGGSVAVTATLAGSLPRPGFYAGTVLAQGDATLRIPYLFIVGDGVAANFMPLLGDGFEGTVGQTLPEGGIAFRITDNYGLPVQGAPVSFAVRRGPATLKQAATSTDQYGVAFAVPVLGATPGPYTFTGSGAGLRFSFTGVARAIPQITADGVVNSASGTTGAIVPGSYISIVGSNLSDFFDWTVTPNLPLALDEVLVSFDVPSANLSLPGRIRNVSNTQVDVQVPWELDGQSSVQVKVTVGFTPGNVVTVPVAKYSPAIYENNGAAVARDSAGAAISAQNPARQGQTVRLIANGLGAVSNQPPTGEVAAANPSSQTVATPVVNIGGQTAKLQFSGLLPGTPGVYAVDVVVPQGLAAGPQTVSMSVGGQTSKTLSLPVQ